MIYNQTIHGIQNMNITGDIDVYVSYYMKVVYET